MSMDLDQVRELLPLYIQGSLPVETSLQVSQTLAQHPELLVDLRLALALREALKAQDVPPPAFPKAVYEQAQAPANPLNQGIKTLKDAGQIARSALRAALRFV